LVVILQFGAAIVGDNIIFAFNQQPLVDEAVEYTIDIFSSTDAAPVGQVLQAAKKLALSTLAEIINEGINSQFTVIEVELEYHPSWDDQIVKTSFIHSALIKLVYHFVPELKTFFYLFLMEDGSLHLFVQRGTIDFPLEDVS